MSVLNISNNFIEDISPLLKLVNLSELNMGYNEIIDISPIRNIKRIRWLWVNNNKISDITVLLDLLNSGAIDTFSTVDIRYNNLNLTNSSNNKKVIDVLIEAGVDLKWEEGNKIY